MDNDDDLEADEGSCPVCEERETFSTRLKGTG